MFYSTDKNDHGLPYNPFKAIVAPRPIGWISSVDLNGAPNLAPYSFFNGVSDAPPIVMFSSTGWKDSVSNVESSGDFVCNLATLDLKDAMNRTSGAFPPGVSEFEKAGLTPVSSTLVQAPRVGEAKVALECRRLQIIQLNDLNGEPVNNWVVFGQVVGVHIDDSVLKNGILDVAALKPLARLGYKDYAMIDRLFQLERPKVD